MGGAGSAAIPFLQVPKRRQLLCKILSPRMDPEPTGHQKKGWVEVQQGPCCQAGRVVRGLLKVAIHHKMQLVLSCTRLVSQDDMLGLPTRLSKVQPRMVDC